MFGLSTLDIVVILLYFIAMILIGVRSMRRIHSQEDFLTGGRGFGKIIQIFANFGQSTSSDTGPSIATTTHSNGASGVWSSLLVLFITPFYWFIAPWYRRLRCISMSDFFIDRYTSKQLASVYAIISTIGLCTLLTVGFIAITKTTMAMTPKSYAELTAAETAEYDRALKWENMEAKHHAVLTPEEISQLAILRAENPQKNFSHLNKFWLIFSIVIIVCLYSVAGGIEAAFVSDLVQGVFIILLSILIIPFAIQQVNVIYGGEGVINAFTMLHQNLPAGFMEVFGSPTSIDFTWYYIAAVSFMSLINITAMANTFVSPASAKDEHTARIGMTFGMYLKRIVIVFLGLTALFVVLLYGDKTNDPDMLWGYASKALLGPLNAGLIGLMIVSLMSALMSTADIMMITTSGLLTRSVYKPLVANKSERHYITAGRFLGTIVVIGAALMTMANDNLFSALKLTWEFGVILSASFWLGILWKKANKNAVWISMISTFALFFLLPLLLTTFNSELRTNEFLLQRTNSHSIEKEYEATLSDIKQRESDIKLWHELHAITQATNSCPESLVLGEMFVKSFYVPQKSIFWNMGITAEDNQQLRGKGLLSFEMVLLQKLGFHLEDNKYAVNETIRVLIRTLFPFIMILIFSLIFTQAKEEKLATERFYAKMKTKVKSNKTEDDIELEISYQNPQRFDHLKLLGKHSNWQFLIWDKSDYKGFVLNLGMVGLILLTLYFFVNIGA